MLRKLVNFVTFQVSWFAIVLSAADGRAWIGLAAAAAHLLLHFVWTVGSRHARELGMVAAVTLGGVLLDQLAVSLEAQVFASEFARVGLVPVWIAALWAVFATTLDCSLGWMQGRYVIAVVFGAIGGPLAYLGAEGLGAVEVGPGDRVLGIASLAIEWAVMMPLAMWVASWRRRGAGASVAT